MKTLSPTFPPDAGAQGESSQHTRPSISSPRAKRPRLNSEGTPLQAPRELPPAPSTSSALPATSYPARPAFQAPARPVGRMIVPSQRPRHFPLESNPFATPDAVRRFHRAVVAAQLRHPQPVRVNDFTHFGASCMRTIPPHMRSLLHRPPNPQPPPYVLFPNRDQTVYQPSNSFGYPLV